MQTYLSARGVRWQLSACGKETAACRTQTEVDIALLRGDGFVGMGFKEEDNTIVMKNFRIWEKEAIGAPDIENYFSERSFFHRMYETSMRRQHVYQRFESLTIVRDTYAYQVDLDEWEQYMEESGFTRLPDQLVERPPEKTYEALIAEISNAVDTRIDVG